MERKIALSYAGLRRALRQLNLNRRPVIVHASLRAIGPVHAEAVLAALVAHTGGVLVPTFTYQTMVRPLTGPPLNGMTYGSYRQQDLMAEIFSASLPPHRMMGVLPRVLLRHPQARRSRHPVLSFGGIHVDDALAAQTLIDPLAPVGVLAEQGGWVLLLGVDHTSNTSIHYGEKLAGRRQFVRWALTAHGTRELPGFPGCSLGFEAISKRVDEIRLPLGNDTLRALPLAALLSAVQQAIKEDPLALLCQQETCERCPDVRRSPFPAD